MAQNGIKISDDIVPHELYVGLIRTVSTLDWKYGWTTTSNTAMRYWHHEVGFGEKENTQDVSERVASHPDPIFHMYQTWLRAHIVPPNAKVLRLYLNAHTYGTDGWPHVDSNRPDELTAVLYLNEGQWFPEWGGETVIFGEDGDIAAACQPRWNRLLTFPSHLLHAPRPLHKVFAGLRIVLVAKFALSGASAPSREESTLLAFLRETGCGNLPHSGRNLLTHLVGTYRILQSRNAEQDVCRAGLFHSVYGTSIMHCTLALDRATVRAQIGERAERLAWLFCVLDRPACWSCTGLSLPLAQGGTIDISSADLADLRLIERANLDEQGILDSARRLAT